MSDIDIWRVDAELRKIDGSKFTNEELSILLQNPNNYINDYLIFFPSHFYNFKKDLPVDERRTHIISIEKQMQEIEKQLLKEKKVANKYEAKIESFMYAVEKGLIYFSDSYNKSSIIDTYFVPEDVGNEEVIKKSVNNFCVQCIEVCKSISNTQLSLFSTFDFCPKYPIIVKNKKGNIIVKLDEKRIKDRLDENTPEGQLILEMGDDIDSLKEYYTNVLTLFGKKGYPLNFVILNSFGITDYNQMYKEFKGNMNNFNDLDNLIF